MSDPQAPPRFEPTEILDSISREIRPAEGGVLELNGARLTVPPGALVEPATLTLIETTDPGERLGEDDGARGGHRALWPHGFALASDRSVELALALTLELPIDRSRLPDDSRDTEIRVSALIDGYLALQGDPSAVSADSISLVLDPPSLPEGPPLSLPARGAGSVPFLAVVGALSAIGVNLQAFQASIDVSRGGFVDLETEHFLIRHRNTTPEMAASVGRTLEEAHAVFVTQMGFTLPRLLSSWTRYTFYIDDFANHASAGGSAGLTLPGSMLLNGASYLNVGFGSEGNNALITTAHEYFHALQHGTTRRALPNAWAVAADPEANWLFEGTATLMGARVARGPGLIDPGLEQHPPAGVSIYAPPALGAPPFDAAQELFLFIERSLGGVAHYQPMFRGLGTDLPLSDIEPSVATVDAALRESGSSLGEAYGGWIRDYLFDNPRDYGGDPAPGLNVTLSEHTPVVLQRAMPPLSYRHWRFTVTGDTSDERTAPADVLIELQVMSGSAQDIVLFTSGNDGVEELQPLSVGTRESTVLFGIRREVDREVRVAVANRGLERADDSRIELSVGLMGDGGRAGGVPYATTGRMVSQLSDGTLVGRDLSSRRTWTIQDPASPIFPWVSGALADGHLLLGTQDRAASSTYLDTSSLVLVGDYGRGDRVDMLELCDGLLGSVAFPQMSADGDVFFIGEFMGDTGERGAIWRATLSSCERLPLDFDGDGVDDVGRSGFFRMLRVGRDGRWLAFMGPGLGLYLAPGSGGEVFGPLWEDGPERDHGSLSLVLAEDGTGLSWSATFYPRDGGAAIDLEPAGAPNRMWVDGEFFYVERDVSGFAALVPGRSPRHIPIDVEAEPTGGRMIRSPSSNLVCFEGGAGLPTRAAYCVNSDGSGLVRLTESPENSVYYWP